MQYKFKNKLTIIAHLPHYINDNNIHSAYEPYVREIEIWAEIFEVIEIFTDLKGGEPIFVTKELPSNCIVRPIFVKSGPGIINNIIRFLQLPYAIIHILVIILKADILHFRSPGITTFIANIINKFVNKPCIVKWATKFGELPIKNKILKWEYKLLLFPPSKTKVLIYGQGSHRNHISFIPALMRSSEMVNSSDFVLNKPFKQPFKLICVGRMYRYKDFDILIKGLIEFNENFPNYEWNLEFIGDGEEMDKLKSIALNGGIISKINFLGHLPFKQTIRHYIDADISIVPGRFEGWAKVINESWAFGVIPLVIDEGNTAYPIQLSDGAGVDFKNTEGNFVLKLKSIFDSNISDIILMRKKGLTANDKMSLENFKIRLLDVINMLIND
jgi:glycosyltransferase involved in cell wall biosynthesis